jgi:hypothetical protein
VFTPHYPALSLPGCRTACFPRWFRRPKRKATRYLAAPDWNWERILYRHRQSYLNGSLGALLAWIRTNRQSRASGGAIGGGVVDVRLGSWSSGTPKT